MRYFARRVVLAGFIAGIPIGASAQESGVMGEIEKSAQTTPEEKIQFADMAMSQMRAYVAEVARMLEVAERDKDMIRIQCLSKKLTTMRALLEVSEAANVNMRMALGSGENETAEHEYRKIAIALAKIKQFRAEADACVGGRGTQAGATQIELMDAGMSHGGDETSPLDLDMGDIVGQPPPTSGFQ